MLRRPALAATALAVVAALTLAGCSPARSSSQPLPSLSPKPISTTGPSSPPPSPGLSAFYRQKVAWHRCRGADLCTRIKVPLNYAHPHRRAISLAVLKVPAQGGGRRVGDLVVNPGGPGGSGLDYAANAASYFDPQVRQAFNIVGFDPRGVGHSTPLQCLTTKQADRFVAADPDPDTPAEVRRADALTRAFGRGCLRDDAGLTRHMSTAEAAKDMDVLRAVLGEPKLVYFGASYGTFLGATYADLFPRRIGRMVLDGAINPDVSTVQMSLVQAHGFEVALRAYVGHCVAEGSCFLGSTVNAGIRHIQRFLASVDAHSLPGEAGRRLTEGNAVLGIWAPLYNRSYWPYLDTALKAGFAGNGSVLMSLSDAYTDRGPNGYRDNSLSALYAVNCLDHDDAITSSQVPKLIPRFEKASPTFGRDFAYGADACAYWPVHSGRVPAPVSAPGAPPILVIGTTRDPATPLVWARALAHQLNSAVLIKRNGDGHTGYHAGNSCVDNTVDSYLVSGAVPKTHEVDC